MADFLHPSADLQAGREAGWNDRQREIDELLQQIADFEERIAEGEEAKVPRPPQLEWFGTKEGQWDSWWIWKAVSDGQTGGEMLWRCVQTHGRFISHDGRLPSWLIRDIAACLPVARTGYPAPVGWKVVGG